MAPERPQAELFELASDSAQEPLSNFCSLHHASRIFDKPRETIRRLIDRAALEPVSGTPGDDAVYRIRDVAKLIYGRKTRSANTPGEMSPAERDTYYRAEIKRLEFEQRARALVPAAAVEREFAFVVNAIAHFLEIFPDRLERDAGISGETVQVVQKIVLEQRAALYESIKSTEVSSGTNDGSGSRGSDRPVARADPRSPRRDSTVVGNGAAK